MSSERAETTRRGARSRRDDPKRAHAELVEQAIRAFQTSADREAGFRFLYRSYHLAMRRFFGARGFSPEDCQDLTQETFLGVYRGLEAYEHQERFEGWLYRLAKNTYRKRLRAAGTAKRAGYEMQLDGLNHERLEESPEQLEAMLDDEQRQAMRRLVHELPEQMRHCLTLRLYHELSYREIAVAMRVKIDTVKAHLFQARRRLREKLGENPVEKLDL